MTANGQGTVGGNAPGGAKQLFLSYGREPEVSSFVSKLKQDLEQKGFSVWLDKGDIPAGTGWVGRIGSAIHQCQGLIAVITNKYVNSDYCTKELNMAHSSRKAIFPVIREEADFTQSEKAAGVKFIIQDINWAFFRPDVPNYKYSESFAQLVDGVTAGGIQPGAGAVEGVDFVPDDGAEAAGIKPKYLNIDDLNQVQKELGHFAKWRELGLNLGLSADLLDVIRDEESRVGRRVEAVLSNWLKQEGIDKTKKPTWHQLVDALEKQINNALAQKIKEKYILN